MTKEDFKKLVRELISEVISEDYKGEPNHEAEVESDKLTATLSEDNTEDIKDLEKLFKNPDPSRVKDYGSIENYKKMLATKIAKLRKQKNESSDPFRDIVKKYAGFYRDSEDARADKANYYDWLQTKAQQDPKLKKALRVLKKVK